MTDPAFPLPALVPIRPRDDGWTPERQRLFLENLAASGSVAAAARSVGMSRESAYALRRRADARGFAQAWEAARVLAHEHLVDLAWDRAVNGVLRPVFYHGEQVGEVAHHDSRLLLGLMAQNRALASAGGGSPLASAAVVGAVIDDWEAALARVERGEALADPGADIGADTGADTGADFGAGIGALGRGCPSLHHPADGPPPPAGAEAVPPPLPEEEDHGAPLNEAQALGVGWYDTWWDEALDDWLTNWPTPPGWSGRAYRFDVLGKAMPLDVWEAQACVEDAEETTENWARTLTDEERAGLERLEQQDEAHRAARLELYRRRAFGLATPAECASIVAANRHGGSEWGGTV